MSADTFFLGENAQEFKTAPKYAVFDMVILWIDENTYVSSPYAKFVSETGEATWQALHLSNGEHTFAYDASSSEWKRNGTAVTLADYGIEVYFANDTPGPKTGDTITVTQFSGQDTEGNNQSELNIELTRSGQKMEANCPLAKATARQNIADALLKSVCAYGYQPFSATSAEVNPLMELGDGITAHGIYSGMFEQTLNFDSMMTSDIGAPWQEETESEYKYETASERKYSRKFADISAEFDITASEIAARVKREGTGTGFGWSLIESAFEIYKTNDRNNPVFKVDATGAQVKGKITATSGYIGTEQAGFTITASAIFNRNIAAVDSSQAISLSNISDANSGSGVYLGTDGIYLGGGKFKVTSAGAVTASNLTITGGEIKLGGTSNAPAFHVTNAGAVTASNLAITGGSISIGNAFSVNAQGELTATSGTFSGHVKANKIDTGSSDGYISGSMFSGGSIGTGNLSSGIITSLGYADYANGVFSGLNTAGHGRFNILICPTRFTFKGYNAQWTQLHIPDEGTYYILTRGNATDDD